MDQLPTIVKARDFIRRVGQGSAPVDIEQLAAAANAKVKIFYDLPDNECGQTTQLRGKSIVIVNGNHSEERQRFTVAHEVAHIVLDLPSNHHGSMLTNEALHGYVRRPEEEILCDVFAAECLLPYERFSKDVAEVEISLDAVKSLAKKYKASLTATGSRFVLSARLPCAFVLIEQGRIRYVSKSIELKEFGGWVDFNVRVPQGSVAHSLVNGDSCDQDYAEISSDVWFNSGIRGRPYVQEEAILIKDWNQCLSLIWFDASLGPVSNQRVSQEDEEPLLRELTGELQWPSRSRRK